MDRARKSPSGTFWAVILLAVAVVMVLRALRPAAPTGLVGQPLPPLEVAGWFNTDGPLTSAALRGKVVLVDCWFAECPPCRAAMPRLVDFYQRYRDDGLVVIGLTPDSGEMADAAKEFVDSVDGLDWPIGYGASMPLIVLGIEAYPTLILFDKSGTAVWAGHSLLGLDEVVTKALLEEGWKAES